MTEEIKNFSGFVFSDPSGTMSFIWQDDLGFWFESGDGSILNAGYKTPEEAVRAMAQRKSFLSPHLSGWKKTGFSEPQITIFRAGI